MLAHLHKGTYMIKIFDQLAKLKLTENGKELLRTIPRSTLFKAKRDFDKIERYIPCYELNTYYAICLRFCELQKCYPDWNLGRKFDINKPVTKKNEKFSMKLVIKIEEHLETKTKDLIGLKEKLLHLNPDGTIPDPLATLRQALKSKRINLKGLTFLQSCFMTSQPKLVHEINRYIYLTEQEMIENIKDEVDNEIEINKNISCINIETVL